MLGKVKGNDHAIGLSIELDGDGLKPLLACSVPNLDIVDMLPSLVLRGYEVESHCPDMLVGEGVVGVHL